MLGLTQSSCMAFNCSGQVSCSEPRWFLENLSNPILHYYVQEDLSQSGTLLHSPFNQQMIQIFQGLLWPFVSGFRNMHFQLLTSALCFPKLQLLEEGRFKFSLHLCSMLQQLHALLAIKKSVGLRNAQISDFSFSIWRKNKQKNTYILMQGFDSENYSFLFKKEADLADPCSQLQTLTLISNFFPCFSTNAEQLWKRFMNTGGWGIGNPGQKAEVLMCGVGNEISFTFTEYKDLKSKHWNLYALRESCLRIFF